MQARKIREFKCYRTLVTALPQRDEDIWLMREGYLIASFLDEQAIDEFVVSVALVFPQCSL